MKPLIVLLLSFAIVLIVTKVAANNFDVALSGRIAMAIMLVFTSVAHFAFTKGMEMMIPPFIPYKKAMVYLTGIMRSVQRLDYSLLILGYLLLGC